MIFVEKIMWIAFAILLGATMIHEAKAAEMTCEEATLRATVTYVEFMDGNRTWSSTLPSEKKMKRICND